MEATQSQIEMTTKWELVEEFKNKNEFDIFMNNYTFKMTTTHGNQISSCQSHNQHHNQLNPRYVSVTLEFTQPEPEPVRITRSKKKISIQPEPVRTTRSQRNLKRLQASPKKITNEKNSETDKPRRGRPRQIGPALSD